ncbi:MAG: dihydrodipicolinate synthase family protein, partial [Pseudomonadota bacterium]
GRGGAQIEPPYLLQTAADRRMRAYTDLAFAGQAAEARALSDSLQPVRDALKRVKPADKPHAAQKRWQDRLGQVGGAVRAPMLPLTAAEAAAIDAAVAECGLDAPASRRAAAG